ncbi:helix-turn-helix domain-containing protein ['Paenibacillus yunnanensis' Narsing Rao et al. 2020]|uniref:helix-turn-helix domain-containing protein n=1 Tax=Paenibacillus tengchongensis TaxID=2608684 RepID=UPI00124E1E72|nr:helix-turn-helix transcriptional regulator [Paenibacillus tengchongensis]
MSLDCIKTGDVVVHDLQEFRTSEEALLEMEKKKIIESIKESLDSSNISIRKLAQKVGMKHPQIIRITSGENYNIETLIKVLDAMNLEITINKKQNQVG